MSHIKKHGLFSAFAAILMLLTYNSAACANSAQNSVKELLGWTADKNAPNLCGGYYRRMISPIPCYTRPFADNAYHLKAKDTLYKLSGEATLKDACIARKNYQLTADTAHVHANKKTGKISAVSASGRVYLIDPNRFLRAETAFADFSRHTITLHNVFYRTILSAEKMPVSLKKQRHAWGRAKKVKKKPQGITDLYNTTYTTCAPTHCVWHLSAHKIELNKRSGRGYATSSVLHLYHIPVFYWPYVNFPIDNRRQSGFLMPFYKHSDTEGSVIGIPYYWNIAPNYDARITPAITTRKGVKLTTNFRYLTKRQNGSIDFSILPYDPSYKAFKKSAKTDYAGNPNLHRLEKSGNTRFDFLWQHHARWNSHLSGNIYYMYSSDDDYETYPQLLQQAQLNYAGNIWHFLFNLQRYQTLHPVDAARAENQYAKLPQLKLNAHLPTLFHGFDLGIETEAIRFTKDRNPEDTTEPVVGNRLSVKPIISFPIERSYGYLYPRLQLQATKYDLRHAAPFQANHPGITVPIFDTQAGLYFDHRLHLFHQLYRQTLEPVLYYLYVPYHNQNRFPVFDTTTRFFNYDNMFEYNRFSGIDRIGDANQVTLGLTTRFLKDNTGAQKASASIGQIYYFRNRRTTLCSAGQYCDWIQKTRKTSPVAVKGTYAFNPHWHAYAGLLWDSQFSDFDNRSLSISYLPTTHHIINLHYNYIQHSSVITGLPANDVWGQFKQAGINSYWKVTDRWSLIGGYSYNWSNHLNASTYLAGFGYEGCCFAARFVFARTFDVLNPDNTAQLKNTYYLEFALKGLGEAGNGDLKSLLTNSINGYADDFGKTV